MKPSQVTVVVVLVHVVVSTFVFVVVDICVVVFDGFVETVVAGAVAVEQFIDSEVLLLLITVVLYVDVAVSVLVE